VFYCGEFSRVFCRRIPESVYVQDHDANRVESLLLICSASENKNHFALAGVRRGCGDFYENAFN
jgi:hypothetical protein